MINTERPAGVHKEADLHAQPVTGGTVVEGDLQIAFPRYRQWLLTLRDRSLGKNITKAYRMAASRFLGLAANGRSRVSPRSALGTLLPVSFLGTCHSDMQTE